MVEETNPRVILFDLDGTLTDPFTGITRCIEYALERQGLPVPGRQQLRDWIGPPLLHSFSLYFSTLGKGDANLALGHYRQRFSDTGIFENEVYPGIPELLDAFRQSGRRLYVATAKPGIYARRIVRHFSLDEYLENVHGSELDGARTDKVELLRHIVDKEGLEPGFCAMVGDRKHDVSAARYHGMRAVGVLWGYGSESELLDAGAEYLAAAPEELLELVPR